MRCEIYHNFLFTRMKYINLLNEQIKANIKYKMKIEGLCLHSLSYSPNITVTKTKKNVRWVGHVASMGSITTVS